MENLEEMWDRLQLKEEEEDKEIEINDEELERVQRKGDLCLIGKIWVERKISKSTIEAAMGNVWRLNAKVVFNEVGPNIYVICFTTHADGYRAEDGRP